jgi:DNA-binding GntR family transcriptional regulator
MEADVIARSGLPDAPLEGVPEAREDSLSERAYRLIENAIVTLSLQPGARFTEQEIAARLGLGRTPVREALLRLVGEGLVQVFPRRGFVVAPINPLDVLQALEVRAVLEPLVASAAARRTGPQAAEGLGRLGEAILKAAESGDVAAFMRVDEAIDRSIADLAANAYASRALAPLQTMARRAWFFLQRRRDLSAAATRHAALTRAVAAGDPLAASGAASALVEHVRDGLKGAVAAL